MLLRIHRNKHWKHTYDCLCICSAMLDTPPEYTSGPSGAWTRLCSQVKHISYAKHIPNIWKWMAQCIAGFSRVHRSRIGSPIYSLAVLTICGKTIRSVPSDSHIANTLICGAHKRLCRRSNRNAGIFSTASGTADANCLKHSACCWRAVMDLEVSIVCWRVQLENFCAYR